MARIIKYYGYNKISKVSLLNKNANLEEKIWAFIEDLEGKQIVSIVDEAKKYCYKVWSTGEIKTICKKFVDNEVNFF